MIRNFNFGPLALTNTYTTNILNPGTTTGGTNGSGAPYLNLRIVLSQIRIINKTTSAATFRLFRGLTTANTAGTELAYDKNCPANDYVDLPFFKPMVFDVTDFLVGGASAATTLTIQGFGVIFLA